MLDVADGETADERTAAVAEMPVADRRLLSFALFVAFEFGCFALLVYCILTL